MGTVLCPTAVTKNRPRPRKLKGFDAPDAVMTAIEARSSSPVRIKRDAGGLALASPEVSIKGIYPAGEGAGYAGGILSAAADGYHAAMHVLSAE